MDEFPPLQEKYQDTYETLTGDGTAFLCLDWNNPELALRSGDLQYVEILFMSCFGNLPYHSPQF